MKTGKSLVELAQSLEHIKTHAKDFIVPVERLRAEVVDMGPSPKNHKPELRLAFENGSKHTFDLNPWSSSQLATYADIPKAYFDRLAEENPALAAENVNHGFDRIAAAAKKSGKPEARMLRTIDGRVRGLLSSRYRILDAHDLLETILPIAQQYGLQVVSAEITDRRLFVKLLSPKLTAEVKTGDVVQYGLTISTSDVGSGACRIEPFVYRLVCLNGMISTTAVRHFHVGRNQDDGSVREIMSDRTKEVSDAAFWLTIRDATIASLKPENFEREVNRLRIAAELPIKNFDLPNVVELTMKATGITGEGKKNSILAALASGNEGAGLTQYGLINAFTRAAQSDEIDYEASIELERAGGQILELPKKDWQRIADAVVA